MVNGFNKPCLAVTIVGLCCIGAEATAAPPEVEQWSIVANNGYDAPGSAMPGSEALRKFNSYNPPSINASGLVVFRARSTGQQQGPFSGVFLRDLDTLGAIRRFVDRRATVPEPNNTFYPVPGQSGVDELGQFNEFPSFPRIAQNANLVATRGNHRPVWTYVVGTDPDTGEPIESRVGTTGIYVNLDAGEPISPYILGVGALGSVPEFSLFSVPDAPAGTKFDVFPGSPVITDAGVVAFKGNYTEAVAPGILTGKTGIYYRQLEVASGGGGASVQWIANSNTVIPNPGPCVLGTTFGSTAPPSGSGDQIVFVGLDNEEQPSCGGIYLATLFDTPEQLTTLVDLNTQVPDEGGATFSKLGEGLSFDGRFVGFWGAWGPATKTVRLYCSEEGNSIRRNFCNNSGEFAGRGDPLSVCDDTTDDTERCYQERNVPVNQGVFAYDTVQGTLSLLARTGDFDDFTYWNYSGAPPGMGESEGDAEPPRWRSSAFLAVSSVGMPRTLRVAFQARTGEVDPNSHLYTNPIDGIYLTTNEADTTIEPLVETGTDGTLLDPAAVWDDDEDPLTPAVPLPIASVTLEREAFRGDWLAISASMGVEEAGWAGLYATKVRQRQSCLLVNGELELMDRSSVDVTRTSAGTTRLHSQALLRAELEANVAQFVGYATVDGDASVGNLIGASRATITGALATGVVAALQPIEWFAVSTTSTAVIVSWDSTVELPPGEYGAVQMRDRSTLRLTSGSYSFQSLNVGTDALLVFDATSGPVSVSVNEGAHFGDRVEVVSVGTERFPAFLYSNASIEFGHDGLYEVFASAQGSITVRDRTYVAGCLQSNASVWLGHDTALVEPGR